MKKKFKTLAVMGAYSGILLERPFSDVHEVIDHFYPHIMTHELPSVAAAVKAKIEKQLSVVIPWIDGYNYIEYGNTVIKAYGDYIELDNGVLENLANFEDALTRAIATASNIYTAESDLDRLSNHKDMYVRYEVAKNPSAQDYTLEHLSHDEKRFIRMAVTGHPNTPVLCIGIYVGKR